MRVSMGRLSPQGAMMMWESPVVGTTIPRGCRGRATTINDQNRPVEIQTYRTPDPRKTDPDSEEQKLLDRLRPTTVRHERLLILPPEVDADIDGDGSSEPTYSAYAAAEWVLASARPDLDPVRQRARDRVDGRAAASPMALFGLDGPPLQPRFLQPEKRPSQPPTLRLVRGGEDPEPADPDSYEGYGPEAVTQPSRLNIGDLVLVDEDLGMWAVVDAEPEEDLTDPDCLAISWRGDEDEAGVLSVAADELVSVRRPTDVA
jgi:hypothetical protein